jgi:hypothetical protein
MNIIIKQREIEAGIKLYLLQQGIQIKGKTTEISFTAGRKDTGLSAEIEINEEGDGYAIIDAMIQKQAPVAPVIAVPEVVVATQPVELLTSPAAMLEAAEKVGVFMHDTMTAEEEQAAEAEEVKALFAAPAEEVEAEPTMPAFTQALGSVFQAMAAPAVEVPVAEAKVLVQEDPAPWEAEEAAVPAQAPAVKTVSLFA